MIYDLNVPGDPTEVPAEWWVERMRLRRDGLLSESDWTQASDDPTGNIAAWAQYRQALRDAPANWTPGPTWEAPEQPA